MKNQVIWMTGLSGAGKTTIATTLLSKLKEGLNKHMFECVVLDGDVLRGGLCSDLGFSDSDRTENIRRAAEVAALLKDHLVIVSMISPKAVDRALARKIVGGRFLEVYVSTPIEICRERDPKGLYKKVDAGLIKNFTGVDSIYEPPVNPDLIINGESPEYAAKLIEEILWDSD